MMANRKKIPTIIQEQNSYPGITNKLLSKKSTIVCVAYDGLDTILSLRKKIVKTGNPVRASLLSIHVKEKIQEANKLFQLKTENNNCFSAWWKSRGKKNKSA